MSLVHRVITFFRNDTQHCSCYSNANWLSESSSTLTGNGLGKRRICKHQRWKAFIACYVHIIPLAVTAFVVSINLSSPFLENEGSPDQNLLMNGLQFAAKLHEIFMAASLSLVAVNFIQYELFIGRGLPLNSVPAGFQITSFSSIFSSRPWEKKLFVKGSKARRIGFIALLSLLVVLCATTGPSSAILILPATGWWKYPLSFALVPESVPADWDLSKGRFFINANESTLWPSLITSASFLPPDCTFPNTDISDSCPTGGLSILNSSIDQVSLTNSSLEDELPYTWNLTLPVMPSNPMGNEQVYRRYIEGIHQDGSVNFVARTTAASVDKVLNHLSFPFSDPYIGANIRWEISLLNGTKTLAPQTLVLCTANRLNLANGSTNSSIFLDSPPEQLNFTLRSGQIWTTDAGPLVDLLNQPMTTTSMWREPPPDFGSQTPSIAATFVTVYLETMELSIQACSIYASWQPVDVYLEPKTDKYFHLSTMDDYSLLKTIPSDVLHHNDTYPIQLDIDWANSDLPCNETVGLLTKKVEAELSSLGENAFGYSLSVVITDALARVWMDVNVTLALDGATQDDAQTFEEINFISVENFSRVDLAASIPVYLDASRFGYGYTTDGITRRLSIGVLLTYALVVIIHTALVIWHGWICADLASLYDLVVVAMRGSVGLSQDLSLPPAAELKKSDVTVKVQGINDSELKLILGEVHGASKPVVGEEELLILHDHVAMPDESSFTAGGSIRSRISSS